MGVLRSDGKYTEMARRTTNFDYPDSPWINEIRIAVDTRPGEIDVNWEVEAVSIDEMFAGEEAAGGGLVGSITGGFLEAGETVGEFLRRRVGRQEWPVEVEVTPRGVGQIKNAIEGAIDDAASTGGIEAEIIKQQASGLTPSRGGGIGSRFRSAVTGGGFDIGRATEETVVPFGETESGTVSFDFDPVTVPTPSGVSIVDKLKDQGTQPTMSVTFTYRSSDVFTNSQRTFNVDLPLDAFVQEESLDIEGQCGSLFPEIASRANSLPSRVNGKLSGAREARSQLESHANELSRISGASISSRVSQAVDDIRNISPQQLTGGNFAQLKTRVEGTDTRFEAAQELEDEFEDLRDEIEGLDNAECRDKFSDQISGIDRQLTQLTRISEEASDLKDALLDVLGNVDSIDCQSAFSSIDSQLSDLSSEVGAGSNIGATQLGIDTRDIEDLTDQVSGIESEIRSEIPADSPCRSSFLSRADRIRSRISELQQEGVERLGCSDVSKIIRNAVSRAESRVRTFTARDQLARKPEQKEELFEVINNARDRVEEVDPRNPCKQELQARVRDLRTELEASPVRPETALPCEERFSDVSSQLEDFEDQILQLTAPIKPQRVNEIAEQGNEITDLIEDQVPADDPCRQEMSERVRSLVERTQSLTPQIRVETEQEQASEQRRQELIDQLLGSLDTLQSTTNGQSQEELEEAAEEAAQDQDIPST